MEQTIVNLIQTVGLPIALVMYYLFIERPRQEKKAELDIARHDALVDKIIDSQTQCATKMNQAISEHTEVIRELKTLIDNKLKD